MALAGTRLTVFPAMAITPENTPTSRIALLQSRDARLGGAHRQLTQGIAA